MVTGEDNKKAGIARFFIWKKICSDKSIHQ
jgi:hypothetical protein